MQVLFAVGLVMYPFLEPLIKIEREIAQISEGLVMVHIGVNLDDPMLRNASDLTINVLDRANMRANDIFGSRIGVENNMVNSLVILHQEK